MIEKMLIAEKITNESVESFFKTGDTERKFCSPSIELNQPENCKLDKSISDLAYRKFQRIIHDYIDGIEATAALNEEILKRLSQR